MRSTILATVALLASGCALNVRLLEDGKSHPGSFDVASSSMQVTIDGDRYTGPLHRGVTGGLITSYSGTRMSTGAVIMPGTDFQSVLTNSAGRILRCQFNSALGSGQGVCQMNDGRTFALVQGGT